jgi:hypothetical protein
MESKSTWRMSPFQPLASRIPTLTLPNQNSSAPVVAELHGSLLQRSLSTSTAGGTCYFMSSLGPATNSITNE